MDIKKLFQDSSEYKEGEIFIDTNGNKYIVSSKNDKRTLNSLKPVNGFYIIYDEFGGVEKYKTNGGKKNMKKSRKSRRSRSTKKSRKMRKYK